MRQYKNISQKQINDIKKKLNLRTKEELKDLYTVVDLYNRALDGDTDAFKKIVEITEQ